MHRSLELQLAKPYLGGKSTLNNIHIWARSSFHLSRCLYWLKDTEINFLTQDQAQVHIEKMYLKIGFIINLYYKIAYLWSESSFGNSEQTWMRSTHTSPTHSIRLLHILEQCFRSNAKGIGLRLVRSSKDDIIITICYLSL